MYPIPELHAAKQKQRSEDHSLTGLLGAGGIHHKDEAVEGMAQLLQSWLQLIGHLFLPLGAALLV